MASLVLILGLLLLPPVTKAAFNRKRTDQAAGQKIEVEQPSAKIFRSKISDFQFPDRVEAIVWHINAINKGLATGDLSLANLSYAKLIESIRQQNVNESGNYEFELQAVREEYDQFRSVYGMEYPPQFLPPAQRQKANTKKPQAAGNGVIINPGSNFQLTLYNAPANIIQEVKKILDDENTWSKENLLMPLFTQYNIKCREIEEYIEKYRPIYLSQVEELKAKSEEYQNASEMDKADMENDFFEQSANMLYERAACDIDILFTANDIDITVDDELIREYGYETVAKYVGFAYDFDRVRVDYERKDFEDLLKAGLAVSGENVSKKEILKQQTLKTLNKIAEKEEGFFKRKDKAIDFILADQNLESNIGRHISMRRIFKLAPLPDKYASVNLSELAASWAFVREQIRLIVDAYKDSERYTEEIKGDISWVKGFKVEKHEDYDKGFVCLRAREACKKKYSKSNPPKLPLHIGCNCGLRTDV